MRSTAVLDRGTSTPQHDVNDLLVLWQHPVTREIVPIGRFIREGGAFAFSYTRAAAAVDGFRPLPGMTDLHRRYESHQIPAVFSQRVMSPERPDYAQYMDTLGLTSALATPWEQIVESGGDRAGDTLQFMPIPRVTCGRAQARFLANGVSHIPEDERVLPGRSIRVTRQAQEEALRGLRVGDEVLLEPELRNPEDPNAVLLIAGGVPVGWVPRVLSSGVRQLVRNEPCHATVHRIGSPNAPFHLRLVLDLNVPVPSGFAFDREGRWQALAS